MNLQTGSILFPGVTQFIRVFWVGGARWMMQFLGHYRVCSHSSLKMKSKAACKVECFGTMHSLEKTNKQKQKPLFYIIQSKQKPAIV